MNGDDAPLARARALLEQNRAAEAEALCAQACERDPANAQAWFLLGAARHRQGQIAQALAAFGRSAALDPTNVSVISAQATMLSLLSRAHEAVEACRRALALAPGDPQLRVNLGLALEQSADAAAALQQYGAALAARADFPAALMNRAALLNRVGRHAEALADNDRLAALRPALADAHFNRADTLIALGRYEHALAACDRAIALDTRHARAYFDRGIALSMLRRFGEAQAAFDAARALNPRQAADFLRFPGWGNGDQLWRHLPLRVYLHKRYEELKECNWVALAEYVANFEHIVGVSRRTPFPLDDKALGFAALALPLKPETRFALAKCIAKRIAETVTALPPSRVAARGKERVRIGYLSPDFRVHPAGLLTRRLYGLHDRSRFEVFGYSLAPDDGSAVRRDIEQGCDRFVELSSVGDLQAAERIRADGIDILVDMAGYTTSCRTEIVAMRPAPLALNYLGYPGTMGADFVDYRITDRIATPPEQEGRWTEKLVFMPETYMIYNNRQPIADAPLTRREHGLPGRGFVFCSFNNSYKIEPVVFGRWMSLLRSVPGSVLWLFKANEKMVGNLGREAAKLGVDPARLVYAAYVPIERHLARSRLADLFLDSLWFNGHTTACDALWAGLPVLTCPGPDFASCGAASIVRAAGLPELAVRDLDEYERLACRLATHNEELAELKARLARNRHSSPLFATERYVKHLEMAYLAMGERHRAGLVPASFDVPALPA